MYHEQASVYIVSIHALVLEVMLCIKLGVHKKMFAALKLKMLQVT